MHTGEPKTQEQNSVLLRRGESQATSKSVGYFSKKQFSARSKKADFRDKERHNARNIKNETKPVYPTQPVVEGWAKRAPSTPYGGGYYPQAGFPNIPVRNMSPATGTHVGPGHPKKVVETMNQPKMQLISHERPHMTAKTNYNNIPCSQFGATSSDRPVWSLNVPSPPQLEKLDVSSLLKPNSGNIHTPCESSPVMSYGNSSDGESDIAETVKTSSSSTPRQLPHTGVTGSLSTGMTKIFKANSSTAQSPTQEMGSPNIEVTQANKACLSSAQPPSSNLSGTSNINVTDTSKANVNNVQSFHPVSTGTPDISDTIKVTDTLSGEASHVKDLTSKVATSQNSESRDQVEARKGTSKDHYHNLDKRQKIKLYEKRKRYYLESRKKFYAEKGDKKHFWYKEYEKRKKEYYHLKLYLYKEKKREQMANKIHKESQDSHKALASIAVDSEMCDEPESPKHSEENCKSVLEEDVPYSPTGSPIAFDDIDVSKSVCDKPPKKLPADEKEQEISLNFTTDKLKETLLHIMETLSQQASDVKCDDENQSGDTEAMSERNELVETRDEFSIKESTSTRPAPPKVSESFLSLKTTESFLSSSSLPLPLQEMLQPPSISSPLLDKALVPAIQPSLSDLQLTSHISSKNLPKKSSTVPSACTPQVPAPPPQSISGPTSTPPLPVPPPQSISDPTSTTPLSVPPPQPASRPTSISLTFSVTSNKNSVHQASTNSGKNSSCPNSEGKAELPLSAPPMQSFLGETLQSGIPVEHSLPKCLSEYITLPPLPSSPPPPLPGQELTEEMSRYVQDSACNSVTSRDEAVPPLPPPPPPPLFERLSKLSKASTDSIQEIDITDDMTEVPMDIDSDDDKNYERNDCPKTREDRDYESSGCQDNNEKNDNVETSDCLNNNDDTNVTENSNNKGPEGLESDKDFLALFGVHEDNSSALEEETGNKSAGDLKMTTLLRKLMNVTTTKKPVDELQTDRCGHSRVHTPSVLERPNSGVHPMSHKEKEIDDSDSASEQKILPVTNVNVSKEVDIVSENDTPGKTTKEQEADVTSLHSCSKINRKRKSHDGTIDASLKGEIEIITPKEPPRNLICVDEILLSVEAADQPTDLQIIYADLRKTPRGRPNVVRVSTFVT